MIAKHNLTSVFDGVKKMQEMFDSVCTHGDIREHTFFPDGSIDGKCHKCGAVGFAIVDKAYDQFLIDMEDDTT